MERMATRGDVDISQSAASSIDVFLPNISLNGTKFVNSRQRDAYQVERFRSAGAKKPRPCIGSFVYKHLSRLPGWPAIEQARSRTINDHSVTALRSSPLCAEQWLRTL